MENNEQPLNSIRALHNRGTQFYEHGQYDYQKILSQLGLSKAEIEAKLKSLGGN